MAGSGNDLDMVGKTLGVVQWDELASSSSSVTTDR